jgi:hypothetical protein
MAETGWRLSSIANSDVAPGGEVEFAISYLDYDEVTSEPMTLSISLPPGLTAVSLRRLQPETFEEADCPTGVAGRTTITCTASLARPYHAAGVSILTAKAQPSVSGVLTAKFEISGGGGGSATTADPTVVSSTLPSFGFDAFDVQTLAQAGGPFTRAGAAPYSIKTYVYFNSATDSRLQERATPVHAPKDVVVELPAGLVGDVAAFARCTLPQLHVGDGTSVYSLCPTGSQIGTVTVPVAEGAAYGPLPLFNMVAPTGVAARFGFDVLGTVVVLDARLSQSGEPKVIVTSRDIPEALASSGVYLDFWGVPGLAAHDIARACPGQEGPFSISPGPSCPVASVGLPLLRLPTSCTGGDQLTWRAFADSWTAPGALDDRGLPVAGDPNWVSAEIVSHNAPGYPYSPLDPTTPWGAPAPMTGCAEVPVAGTMTAQPSAREAETPSGLYVDVSIPNPGLEDPEGTSTSDVKRISVTLPRGMTINPSQAEGLGVCTPAQYESTELSFHPDGSKGCPSDSKIGTVTVHTQLLEEEIDGTVYLAKPFDNPFGSLLALYVVLENPQRGILIKQPGKIETDPVTGQITATFDDMPQLPFYALNFKFREGARAPLVTPPSCGTYTTQARFTPWSDPSKTLVSLSQFETARGIGGGPCPAGGTPPFAPQSVSGTINNNAGSYSSFYLHITRNDGEQEITRFSTVLPPGLSGNLTGIPFCPDTAIEAARRKTGQQELAEPSCSAASEIGHTIVGAGVGSVLAHTPGKVYLAGPYKGAPLSIVSITSATVGPFDLGTVVIRFGLDINPITAQAEVDATSSDPIPHILDGIVVHVRDIRVYIDRQKFIRNPTSCAPMAIENSISGAGADYTNPADQHAITVGSRFQAADCSALGFKPSFKVATNAATSRANGASLHVTVTYPRAPEGSQANIRSVKVSLPKQLPSRLTTLQKACRDSVFEINPAACPPASRVGYAKAITPLIPVPLEGPAFFVSHGGAKFPELVIVLQGYGLTIDLHGETFISEKTNITSSTFRTVPDQPLQSFQLTLPQGRYSALAAIGDVCAIPLEMPTAFTAQNGAVIHQATPITVSGCKPRLLVRRHKVNGTNAKLTISVPLAGRLSASGKGIIAVRRRVAAPGQVGVQVTLTAAERRFLATRSAGRRVRVRVSLTLTASRGRRLHTSLTLLLG